MIAAAVLVGVLAGAPATAAWPTTEMVDPYGADAITKGRYDHVEKRLETAYSKGRRSVEVLLNLAAIRLEERDGDAAQTLYRQVLAQPNADMLTVTGTAWSHDIARPGLRQVSVPVR